MTLTLPPPGGTVYVDTQVLVYSVERHPVYAPLLRPLWQAAQARTHPVVSTELALMEVLVLPLRNGDAVLVSQYERALLGTELRLIPLDQAVLREAARLRATLPPLRTPDAIHAATARLVGSSLFLSNDTGFRRVPGLNLILLDDLRGP
jgi:predicted nucleic acid-binding protein